MLHRVLGGHKRKLDVMFCSPAQCGTWDEGAGSCRVPRDAVICDVPSGEQNEVGPILGLHQ